MDTPSQLELERVRERNRIAKRKSRARQRQQQETTYERGAPSSTVEAIGDAQTWNLEGLQASDRTYKEPAAPPLNNGSIVGGASIFETVEMDNESQNWLNFPIPGDYIEDCGIQTPEYSRLTVSSASTPADESLHLPQSKGPSFPPHSPTMNECLNMSRCDSSSTPTNSSSSSPRMLHLAVRNGSEAIAQALLAAGASANSRDDTGALPLHLAVQNRRHTVAKLLLGYGADPNAVDEAGITPLELAVRSRDEDMVKLLLSSGARVR